MHPNGSPDAHEQHDAQRIFTLAERIALGLDAA